MRPRVSEAVDDARRITLKGNVHPLARAEFDRGAVGESQPMKRILLMLKRSDEQEAALQDTLEKLQDKSSPSFHQWLTPEQFGARFGPADEDIQAVTDWLTRQGFSVEKVYSGRTVIEFSGTAGQVQRAFGTAIHSYQIDGKTYSANAGDPGIPAALAPVVTGVVSLHNFSRDFYARRFGVVHMSGGKRIAEPLVTMPNPFGPGTFYGVGPGDFAKIYGVPATCGNPATACDGSGQTIAIVGETNLQVSDVQQFRGVFGLPSTFDANSIVYNGEDPGITTTHEEAEADLDTQWSGGVAPGATIKYVLSASTPASQGVDLSALYIVEHNLAAVMSESYGACESGLGVAENSFVNSLWQQASAQGITVAVSTGDSGSAGCDDPNSEDLATHAPGVNGLASTPYNVAVGGTDFDEYGTWTNYWSSTNDSVSGASAKGYIPEIPWNQSCAQLGPSGCNINSTPDALRNIVAAGGGPSAKYSKPSWQVGIVGMPSDGKRDLPDVSLLASPGFNGSGFLYCQSDASSSCVASGGFSGSITFGVIGGTSASAPAFAGIMALINQSQATPQNPAPRQGNANYVLYALANKSGASCVSATPVGAGCVFNDVAKGSSALPTGGTGIGTISVPCKGGVVGCSALLSSQIGVLDDPNKPGSLAWNAGTGYDRATGLGSLNVGNLAATWGSVASVPTTTTLTLTPQTGITHGSENVSTTISVTPKTATGTVSLIAKLADGTTVGAGQFTLGANGSVSGTATNLPGGTNYPIHAHYSGDGVNAPSDSASQSVTVAQENSGTFIVVPTFDPVTGNQTNGNATSISYGTPYIIRMYVTNSGGAGSATGAPTGACSELSQVACPSGTVGLTDNGTAVGTGGGGLGVFNLNSEGYTRDLTPNLPGGTHNLVATYNGDTSYKASTSATTTLTVVPAAMQLTLIVPTSTVIGIPAGIAMSGTTTAVGSAPVGTLSVYDGSTVVFSATGPGLGGTGGNGTGSGSLATAGFAIDTAISLPGLGSHSLTMTYGGDPNYLAVTTSPQVVQVVYPTTMQLQSSATTVNYGSTFTLTATVSTTEANPPVTGQITFTSNTGQGTIVMGPTTQTMVNGFAALQATATVTLQSSSSFYANYSGDSNYSAATAYWSNVSVNPPDFSIAPSQTGLIITAGQSASMDIVVTPTFSLSSAVQFQVPTPVVQGISCNVSPAQVQFSGTNSAKATLTCSVPAPSSSPSATEVSPLGWPKPSPPNSWWKLSSVLAVLAIVLWLLPVRLRIRRLAYVLLCLSTITVVLGCGGGGGGGNGGGGGGGGGSATPTSTTLSFPSTKVSAPNLAATVRVNGANSPAGSVSLGVVGESWSFSTATLANGAAQFSYYLGAPGAFSMTASYGGDSRNLPSKVQAPLTVVQTGAAGNMTVNVAIGPTWKQTSVTLTIQ
ncbi:MAG TPA: Ig-like domain repeat protein [Candidatus Limnocylindrales bacterium]|nr:Ig-like domain repeat protein [Candidatus Limnocylindrales bacterium]